MRQVTVEAHISASREEIFDFVADLAGRPAYTDRFVLRAPFGKEYAGLEITEADRPRRIVERVRVGRLGRSHSVAVYEFAAEAGAVTHVELTTYSEPATLADALKQIGAPRWIRRQTKTALERLRMIFEEPPAAPLARVTIAGYEPLKAPRFGLHPGDDPAHPPGLRPSGASRSA
jgi:hypothetical protein